jgi:hypothetical protein
MQTRRKFIRDWSLAAAVTSLIPTSLLAGNSPARLSPPGLGSSPNFEQFARQLNTYFTVPNGAAVMRLQLVEVKRVFARNLSAEDSGNEKFSLLFRGPAQSPLTQDTHTFEHSQLGCVSIFIVPIAHLDATACHYEAIFNRPVNSIETARQLARAPRRLQTC